MVYSSTIADEDTLDAVFTALAHPVRRRALRELATDDRPTAMNALAETLEISPQALNKHLTSLERAGLISREKHGRTTHARTEPEALRAAEAWISEMTAYWNTQLDSLADYIDRLGLSGRNPRPDDKD